MTASEVDLSHALNTLSRHEMLEEGTRMLLTAMGYDLTDQHFQRTPARVAAVLEHFSKNGSEEAVGHILEVSFDSAHDTLVLVGPIKMVSFCAHHMLPVVGQAWVGYLPDGRVCGLSKLARVVHHFCEQFTVQEEVTQLVADSLLRHLAPRGVMVVIRAEHGCMTLRGVTEPEAVTTTSAVRGLFLTDEGAKAEFLSLMRLGSHG